MHHLLFLLLIPTAILIGGKVMLKESITTKEFLAVYAAILAIMVGGFFTAQYMGMLDTEVWGGVISSKDHGSEHCCHCHQECDQCPDNDDDGGTHSCNCREVCLHPQDYWWSLRLSTGDTVSIDSCEPDEYNVPRAWTAAYVGEPAAAEHSYQNYLKADPGSVLRSARPEGLFFVPNFPRVHDFYKVSSAINQGTRMPVEAWNRKLMEMNADMGSKKQVHAVIIATMEKDPEYATAVEVDWLFGPKNALIFVLGMDTDGETVKWARVVTISEVEMLKIRARDEMPGMKISDVEAMGSYIRDLTYKEFTRTPMETFDYMRAMASPPAWLLWVLYLLDVLIAVGGVYLAHTQDFFKEQRFSFRRQRY